MADANSPEYFDSMHGKQENGNLESCEKTFTELGAAIKEEADNKKKAELLWRQARACFDVQDCKLDDQPFREKWIRDGIALAEQAVEADAENGYAHKWLAVMLWTLSPMLGISDKIAGGHRVKEHADKAAVFRPEDPTIFLILTEFCMTVAAASWFEKKAAALIFGAPPESTYEEALAYSLKGCELEMKNTPSGDVADTGVGALQARAAVNTAKCYMELSNKAEAKAWFEKALLVQCFTETDKNYQVEAKEALTKL